MEYSKKLGKRRPQLWELWKKTMKKSIKPMGILEKTRIRRRSNPCFL
jgi:hypothetical protein